MIWNNRGISLRSKTIKIKNRTTITRDQVNLKIHPTLNYQSS